MSVVAAGVHTALVGGGVGHLVLFQNGQRVGIRPEGDGILPAKVKEGAQGAFHGGENRTVQPLQGAFQIGHGPGQAAVQLGNPVQRPAVINQLHRIASDVVSFIIVPEEDPVNFSLCFL